MNRDSDAIRQQLLVVRCQLNDRAALEELVNLWERRLLFYVRRLVPDGEAFPVLQEVWVKVLTGVGALKDPIRFAPWLYSLARHAALDHLRDDYARRQLLAPAAEETPEPESGDDTAGRFDDAEQIHYGLSRLSVVEREVLALYFLEDLSVGEVAEVLGVPAGTVKSRLFHARKSLRAILEQRGGHDE